MLYCIISPSVLLLPTSPAFWLHYSHPLVALLLLPRFSALRIQSMIVPLPLKDKFKLHLLIGRASTDAHPSYSFHPNVWPLHQCIIYIQTFRPAWASFNRFSKRTVPGSKLIKRCGIISVWGILDMALCGRKKETFKIAVRQNSPHKHTFPNYKNARDAQDETLSTSTDSHSCHSLVPRPKPLYSNPDADSINPLSLSHRLRLTELFDLQSSNTSVQQAQVQHRAPGPLCHGETNAICCCFHGVNKDIRRDW